MNASDAKLGALIFLVIACLGYGLRARPARDHHARLSGSTAVSSLTEKGAPVLLLLDVARRSGSSSGG